MMSVSDHVVNICVLAVLLHVYFQSKVLLQCMLQNKRANLEMPCILQYSY